MRNPFIDRRYGGLSGFGFGVVFLGTIFALIAVVCVAIIAGGRITGRTGCANWGMETGIPTKFVILNFGNTGTCFAHAPDGRWVPKDQWAVFVSGQKQ